MHPIVMLGALAGSLALGPAGDPSTRDVELRLPAGHGMDRPAILAAGTCVAPSGPEYYALELFTTRNVPGTGLARARAELEVSPTSPFVVALGPDGSYLYDIHISIDGTKGPPDGRLVAWVTTPELDRIERIGALDENLRASGTVSWNKFLVVVTWESVDDPDATVWSGPVAFRGMSRSGMMHTMVGHGALQQENCAAYGYGN